MGQSLCGWKGSRSVGWASGSQSRKTPRVCSRLARRRSRSASPRRSSLTRARIGMRCFVGFKSSKPRESPFSGSPESRPGRSLEAGDLPSHRRERPVSAFLVQVRQEVEMGSARGGSRASPSGIEPPSVARNPACDPRSSCRDALGGTRAPALQRSPDFPREGLSTDLSASRTTPMNPRRLQGSPSATSRRSRRRLSPLYRFH